MGKGEFVKCILCHGNLRICIKYAVMGNRTFVTDVRYDGNLQILKKYSTPCVIVDL